VAAAQPEPTPVATAPKPRPNGPRSPRHVEWLQGALPIVILIAVAVGAVMYSLRGGLDQYTLPSGRPAVSTPPVAVAPAPNPVDSALEPARYVVAPWPGATPVPVAGAPAPIAPAPTTEEAPVTEAPATTPEPVTTTVTPAAARPAVDLPVPAFRLSVGTFLFQDRAQQRAREITRRTGLSARVKAMGPESARMWRVYVGEFTTETEAEAEADRLLSRGIVTEALVESIPGNASR
jgi:hypothetical protein